MDKIRALKFRIVNYSHVVLSFFHSLCTQLEKNWRYNGVVWGGRSPV